MKKTATVNLYGMEGEGRTVKEAKEDAARKIEHALNSSYIPRLISFRGESCLIWRTPRGLNSALLHNGKIEGICMYTTDSTDEIEESVRFQLAQLCWDEKEDSSPILGDLRAYEFTSWVRFQRRYKEATAQGKSDHEAFTYAHLNVEDKKEQERRDHKNGLYGPE